jgi:acetate kinase
VFGDVLVINAGSSSVKLAVYGGGATVRWRASADGIGSVGPRLRVWDAAGRVESEQPGDGSDQAGAVGRIMDWLEAREPGWAPAAVGHRVVHGGVRFASAVVIDGPVRELLGALVPLAPLHQPPGLACIDAVHARYPDVPMIACFDTAFHAGRTFARSAYALPRGLFDAGVRRYGFHGLSYEFIVGRMRELAPAARRLVVAHLGNGASLCAVHDGRSFDTTMGFTALDGLPMGTRCGAIDPGVLLYLLRERSLSVEQVDELLWKHSGLLGVSGLASDMRELLASDRPEARDAVEMFVDRVVSYVGALAAAMGGLDALVFTAGIGEHAPWIREQVCRRLAWLGLDLDPDANAVNAERITSAGSAVSVWVVPTDEELMIARHVAATLSGRA